ncbi:MAG: hypothetical protein DSZ23_01725 [Thermodesulfatator sp.]|nr:MAG: hypothetical protein DSZ23_01725 [Thermodesulfatator sp.]
MFRGILPGDFGKVNRGKHFLFVPMAWERPFLSRFTNSRCAGYILILDTYFDNPTTLRAAKPGFPLVKS